MHSPEKKLMGIPTLDVALSNTEHIRHERPNSSTPQSTQQKSNQETCT